MSALIRSIWEAKWGKAFVVCWLISVAIVLVTTAISAMNGEALGGFAFSVLPAAVFLNISAILAVRGHATARSLAKVTWLLLALAVFAIVLFTFDSGANRDADVVLIYAMLALSFPFGLAGVILASAVAPVGYVQLTVIWLSCLGLGYLQWFVVVPRLMNMKRDASNPTEARLARH